MTETATIYRPRLLATGFGPFPGAQDNPTEVLMRALAQRVPEDFGASAFRAEVLKTEYHGSWTSLQRLYSSFAPDVVVHFGLNAKASVLQIERAGRNIADFRKPDASAGVPPSPRLSEDGPETIASTFAADAIVAALEEAGFPAALSDDAGDYVCNATLYRSLLAAPEARHVGFVHVPLVEPAGRSSERLLDAAGLILMTAAMYWRDTKAGCKPASNMPRSKTRRRALTS